ncbi:MAG: hypothetical protein A2X71_07010 [Thiobacillus sp. GWE1_62_9]|nr:MAG: hypothetical protein A2X71_07010 [Thiobacillus sp. GWE1_62_9]
MRKIPRRILIGLGVLLLLVGLVGLVAWELLSSALEAKYLARTAQKMTWQIRPGPSDRIRFPGQGPYDMRLGYSKLPDYLARLDKAGWQIDQQAKISIQMARLDDLGLFLPYHEKDQAGFTLLDTDGVKLYQGLHPSRVYGRFDDIPKVLVDALLYIENRELLTEEFPTRNPAVEWDRLAQALMEKGISFIDTNRNVPGGSTLPTQIEKYRHSPEGLTGSMGEKLRQMGTASLRAYLDGPNTLPMRRKTVMAYLNTVPLAAAPRYGEVNGIGDGLWAWYGLDFSDVNRILAKMPRGRDAAYASALKHALSLVVAERRPSYYLAANRKALDALTDDHLDLLANAGLIPRALADQAGTTMAEVVDAIRRVTDLMGEISAASSEQSSGVAQIGQAVTQMDQATQQNSALVEEMAAAASSLRGQAGDLVRTVGAFKLEAASGHQHAAVELQRRQPMLAAG